MQSFPSNTGGIQGISREQVCDELGLHLLVKRRQYNKLVFFRKCKLATTILPLLLSRFLLSRKLCAKIIFNLYYKTSFNNNKIIQMNIFSILYKRMGYKKENSLFCIYDQYKTPYASSVPCVPAELKLKPLNNSSCAVIFTILKDQNLLKILGKFTHIF